MNLQRKQWEVIRTEEERYKFKCAEYEKLINYEDMIYRAIKNKNTITISSTEALDFSDLL